MPLSPEKILALKTGSPFQQLLFRLWEDPACLTDQALDEALAGCFHLNNGKAPGLVKYIKKTLFQECLPGPFRFHGVVEASFLMKNWEEVLGRKLQDGTSSVFPFIPIGYAKYSDKQFYLDVENDFILLFDINSLANSNPNIDSKTAWVQKIRADFGQPFSTIDSWLHFQALCSEQGILDEASLLENMRLWDGICGQVFPKKRDAKAFFQLDCFSFIQRFWLTKFGDWKILAYQDVNMLAYRGKAGFSDQFDNEFMEIFHANKQELLPKEFRDILPTMGLSFRQEVLVTASTETEQYIEYEGWYEVAGELLEGPDLLASEPKYPMVNLTENFKIGFGQRAGAFLFPSVFGGGVPSVVVHYVVKYIKG